MARQSAGILVYRIAEAGPEFFLVHPGGPFWSRKDLNCWSIPKGEIEDSEDPLKAAKREFEEETGIKITGNFIRLSPVRQKSGKTVHCFACEGNIDPAAIKSNTFEMEWPPKSGKKQLFPEVDMAEWFGTQMALKKILEAQSAFISEFLSLIPEKRK